MDKIATLPKTLRETLVKSDLSSVIVDSAEIGIDRLLSDGLLKEIPIVSSVVSIIKTTQSISNHLFLKKIVSFLVGLKDIPSSKREAMITKVEESKKYRNKVGEQLLFILDHCEDDIKAEYMSYWFKAFLNETISYKEFMQGASAINKITTDELNAFIADDKFYWDDTVYLGAGLIYLTMDDVSVKNELSADWDDEQKFVVKGGQLEVNLTYLGDKIKEVFKDIKQD